MTLIVHSRVFYHLTSVHISLSSQSWSRADVVFSRE